MASRPGQLEALCQLVDARPWAEVQYTEPSGRLVATMEADDIEQSMSRLGELKALPPALMAELAQYYVEDESTTEGIGDER